MGIYETIFSFFAYGFIGWCTEVAFAAVKEGRFVNRGFLKGPICPIYGVGVTSVALLLSEYSDNLLLLYVMSVVLVTAIEGGTGFMMEKLFHNKWWDYSDMPLNIGGYVCLLFSLVWGIACVVIVKWIHPLIMGMFALMPRQVGWLLHALLLGILLADLATTARAILKINQKMEKLERISDELQKISDDLGENIYKCVLETMEWKEKLEIKEHLDFKEKADAVSEEIKERITELKEKQHRILKDCGRIQKRLWNAFPKMHSLKYQKMFKEVKAYWQEMQNK